MRKITLMLAGVALLITACSGDDDDEGATATAGLTAAPTATRPASTALPASATPGAAAITIDQPAAGSTVTSPVTMSGTADVFEAAFTIDALGDAAGLVLCQRHMMATSGTGTPGTWEGILAFSPPPSDAPITLRAYSFSPRDGAMENLIERSVTASAELPAIVTTSPSCEQEVGGSSLTVSGMALVFEAVLLVDIRRDGDGAPIMTQQVMAGSGTERSPWSTTLDISSLPPGFYDVVAYSRSARDGGIINEFPVQISRIQ